MHSKHKNHVVPAFSSRSQLSSLLVGIAEYQISLVMLIRTGADTRAARRTSLQEIPGSREFRMMRFCFVSAVRVCRTSTILRGLLCVTVALLVACGTRETPSTSPSKIVDLAVAGQT